MALYEGTAIVSRIVGKLGNQIFYRWKNLKVVKQAETSVLMPFSLKQQNIQDAIGAASKAWYDTLDATKRAKWDAYASNWPREDPTPAGIRRLIPSYKKPQHGVNAYQMIAALLASILEPPVDSPPFIDSVFSDVTLFDPYFDGTTLTITWNAPGDLPPNAKARIWIESQQEIFHKQILAFEIASYGTLNSTSVKAALGLPIYFTDILPTTIFLQMDFIDINGSRSRPSNTIEIRLTTPP